MVWRMVKANFTLPIRIVVLSTLESIFADWWRKIGFIHSPTLSVVSDYGKAHEIVKANRPGINFIKRH